MDQNVQRRREATVSHFARRAMIHEPIAQLSEKLDALGLGKDRASGDSIES